MGQIFNFLNIKHNIFNLILSCGRYFKLTVRCVVEDKLRNIKKCYKASVVNFKNAPLGFQLCFSFKTFCRILFRNTVITPAEQKTNIYCPSLTAYERRRTITINIGDLPDGFRLSDPYSP